MKTNFPQRNRRALASFRGRLLYAALIFFVSLFFFSYFGGRLVDALSPIWKSDIYINRGVKNIYLSLRTKDALISENVRLKEELERNHDLILSLRSIATSREALLATYGRSPEGIPAQVLVRPPKTPYDVLMIDAGEREGILVESRVLLPDGPTIGTVVEVFSYTSRVRLFTTSGERTDAIFERGNIPVELRGRGGGNFIFTLPRDAVAEVGDRILSSYTDGRLIGVVGDIEVTSTDAFKTIYAKGGGNPTSITDVLILQ
ncbi:MAG: rod shape-determining protein MreC [Parcubacteria group bacterium]